MFCTIDRDFLLLFISSRFFVPLLLLNYFFLQIVTLFSVRRFNELNANFDRFSSCRRERIRTIFRIQVPLIQWQYLLSVVDLNFRLYYKVPTSCHRQYHRLFHIQNETTLAFNFRQRRSCSSIERPFIDICRNFSVRINV